MDRKSILRKTELFVKEQLAGDSTGHDWWHIWRVSRTALSIAELEDGADLFIIRLAALLHDIGDWKFNDGDDTVAVKQVRAWLEGLDLDKDVVEHVCQIVGSVSFKGAGVKSNMKTLEGMIVQDADRLDALGAVGIARAFSYGGFKRQVLFDPSIKPQYHQSFEQYRKSAGSTISHFYEKLLLLKDEMNTETGRRIAEARTAFMEVFLVRFQEEWQGDDL